MTRINLKEFFDGALKDNSIFFLGTIDPRILINYLTDERDLDVLYHKFHIFNKMLACGVHDTLYYNIWNFQKRILLLTSILLEKRLNTADYFEYIVYSFFQQLRIISKQICILKHVIKKEMIKND